MASLITLKDSNFSVNDHIFLTQVPPNIVATPGSGCFVGFHTKYPASHHVVPFAKLKNIRFMSIFRFKLWWSTHWVGTNGSDLERETQILILDKSHTNTRPYILLLPLIDGAFTASLQPGADDYIDICLQSGSTRVTASSFQAVLYIHAGDDPFTLVKDAMKVVRSHLGTFKLLEEKTPPPIIDKFGWCTWDAFYQTVHPAGVMEGVKSLVDGGCPPGLVLIDDGWQSYCRDDDPISSEVTHCTLPGENLECRLTKFEENSKFREMGTFIRELKEKFSSVKYAYTWHALCGYWGGLRPNVEGLPEAKVVGAELKPEHETMMDDMAMNKIMETGVGLVLPNMAHRLFHGLHSHLESVGVDGVKIDVIQLLELVCGDYGGRVELAKAYYEALTSSVNSHFKGNGVIASMQQCSDFMFLGTHAICLGRVGDDFWCTDPAGDPAGTFWLQGCHMVHCAYNSLWMGNFIHPDWDMFQSTHPCANFHAASRAISGGPIYVSDSVGHHNFPLLKTLVLPDGSVLRCDYHALPTRDCLFEDPLHDGKTMLKIWNLNKFTGVVGAFNCQGGGWCRETRRNQGASEFSNVVSAGAGPHDVEWKQGRNPIDVAGTQIFAMYLFDKKKLVLCKASGGIEIALEPLHFELITISPVTVLKKNCVQFAPIGLVNMLNTGGAIQSLAFKANSARIGVKGSGELRVYVSSKPLVCKLDGVKVGFGFEDCMVTIQVPWQNASQLSIIQYFF